MATKLVPFRLELESYEKLVRIAAEEKRSVSNTVNYLLSDALEKYEEKEHEKE